MKGKDATIAETWFCPFVVLESFGKQFSGKHFVVVKITINTIITTNPMIEETIISFLFFFIG